ncbi:SLBB domain-containing protein [Ruegeria marina]|uniref:SLBB domain-containing protein n=1 Tax=Ruegeria marina TaxID=639004 RepID=UPI000B87F66F|nr:SLBB domain-containing protein [Ruegeria marina]
MTALSLATAAGAEDTLALSQGDTLRIRIFGHPDLTDTYEIGSGGILAIPGLGRITGVTSLAQARDAIGTLIDQNLGLDPDSYSVTLGPLRAVTVGGHVGDPGDIPYSVGIRVAQAIARAGGLSAPRLSSNITEVALISQEQERLALAEQRLAEALMTRARIDAEISGAETFELPPDVVPLVGEAKAEELRQGQLRLLAGSIESYESTLRRIKAATDINSQNITARQASAESLQKQFDLVRRDLERISPLIDKGAITGERVLSLRRDFAEIEGLVAEAVSSLSQARTQQVVLDEELKALDLQREFDLTSQIIAIETEIVSATTSREGIVQTLDAAGAASLPLNFRTRDSDCRLTILRENPDGTPALLSADALTPLQPGDHLEVGRQTRECPALLSETGFLR